MPFVCVWVFDCRFGLGDIKNEQVAGRVWCSGADTGNTLHKNEFRIEEGAGFETSGYAWTSRCLYTCQESQCQRQGYR